MIRTSKFQRLLTQSAVYFVLLASGFSALAQSIVSPTAIPTSIPYSEATPVWIRAQLVAPAGVAPPSTLQLMVQGPRGDSQAGTLAPSTEGQNVYSVRIPLTLTQPAQMYVQGDVPGSGPVKSDVFTVDVWGSLTVTHTIDPSILTGPTELPDAGYGPRPLAAVADAQGVVSRFVANQVIFAGSPSDASAFATKYSGVIVMQSPVDNLPSKVSPFSLIRVDPSQFSANNLDSDSAKMGVRGASKFSSNEGAQLAAFVASQLAAGQRVVLNFVSESQDYLWSTTEEADRNGVSNAFAWPEFDRRAWEFVAAQGIVRRVKVAVIDGGFWLDSSGHPFTDSAGRSDLPSDPEQYNPVNGTPFAGGPNLNTCTGGSSCPWHGNNTVSVALGTLNNEAGAAGLGGQVADPYLSLFDGTDSAAAAGVINSQGVSADIINMSFGGDCDVWCRASHSFGVVDSIFDSALDSGILLVAAAGNSAEDATANYTWPCYYSSSAGNGVYCVGALGSTTDGFGYFLKSTGGAESYSNYGTTVNIWAPTNIHAMPNGSSAGELAVHNGTSASAPYISGVAAMVKALNPSLQSWDIKNIIGHAPFLAGTGSTAYASPVTVGVQPYPAVVAAVGAYDLVPDLTITSPKDKTVYNPYTTPITFTASAKDVNDGDISKKVVWSSDKDGSLGTGASITHDFTYASEGSRTITAMVTNTHGLTSVTSITITIDFQHIKPTPVILWPTNGITINPGTYTVVGYSNDTNPGVDLTNIACDQLLWDSKVASTDLADVTGECQAQLTFTGTGAQKVTLSATNRLGVTGTTTVTVNVSSSPAQLTVAITDPPDGSSLVGWTGGDTSISLSGDASVSGSVQWSWYWYPTGTPSSKQLISTATTNTKSSNTTTWSLAKSGLCASSGTTKVTLELDVFQTITATLGVIKTPLFSSGSAQSNLQIQCMAQPK